MSSKLQWILVRHGDTEWTEKRKLHGGRFDSPLSTRGRRQAALAGQALQDENIGTIFSSPQGRAIQTSEIIGETIGVTQIRPIEGFREQRYGVLEGGPILSFGPNGTSPKILKPFTTILRNLTGESNRRFLNRVSDGVEQARQIHAEGQYLIVSHWGALSALMATLFEGDSKYWMEEARWSPCGISRIQQVEGRWEMVFHDDTRHLEELRR
jgi:broad specificity phosphatase PhoE